MQHLGAQASDDARSSKGRECGTWGEGAGRPMDDQEDARQPLKLRPKPNWSPVRPAHIIAPCSDPVPEGPRAAAKERARPTLRADLDEKIDAILVRQLARKRDGEVKEMGP